MRRLVALALAFAVRSPAASQCYINGASCVGGPSIASTAAITLLTVNGNGIPVTGGLSSLTLNGYERFIYSAALNQWVRSG